MGLVLTNSAALVSLLFRVPFYYLLSDPNRQEDDAKFRELSKRAEDGSRPAGGLSKTFPEVPKEFRVSGCKQQSRPSMPLGLGTVKGWLGTWMLQSCSLSQDRKIILRHSKNSPCLASPESEPKADSRKKDSLLLA